MNATFIKLANPKKIEDFKTLPKNVENFPNMVTLFEMCNVRVRKRASWRPVFCCINDSQRCRQHERVHGPPKGPSGHVTLHVSLSKIGRPTVVKIRCSRQNGVA